MDLLQLDRTRKRRIFYLVFALGMGVVVSFAVADALAGEIPETLTDLSFVAVLAGCLVAIRRFQRDDLAYRIGLPLVGLSFLLAVAIGSGQGTVLYWLYYLPLMYLFFLGKTEGLALSLLFTAALALLLANPLQWDIFPYERGHILRFLFSFVFVVVLAYALEASRSRMSALLSAEQQALATETIRLEAALRDIKTLSGLLPMCAHCKKIRDEAGRWQDVGEYIRDHSAAQLSHGLCPECARRHFPQYCAQDPPQG
jgi:hypothetical protein